MQPACWIAFKNSSRLYLHKVKASAMKILLSRFLHAYQGYPTKLGLLHTTIPQMQDFCHSSDHDRITTMKEQQDRDKQELIWLPWRKL